MPFTFDLCEHITLVTGRCRDRPNETDDTELCSVLKRVALKGSAIFVFFSWDFEALQFWRGNKLVDPQDPTTFDLSKWFIWFCLPSCVTSMAVVTWVFWCQEAPFAQWPQVAGLGQVARLCFQPYSSSAAWCWEGSQPLPPPRHLLKGVPLRWWDEVILSGPYRVHRALSALNNGKQASICWAL